MCEADSQLSINSICGARDYPEPKEERRKKKVVSLQFHHRIGKYIRPWTDIGNAYKPNPDFGFVRGGPMCTGHRWKPKLYAFVESNPESDTYGEEEDNVSEGKDADFNNRIVLCEGTCILIYFSPPYLQCSALCPEEIRSNSLTLLARRYCMRCCIF